MNCKEIKCCTFSLSPPGSITVIRSLDFEEVSTLVGEVVATDAGSPPLSATCLVNVTLIDVNDNAPAFSQVVIKE